MKGTSKSFAPTWALRPQVWLLISTILYFFPFLIGSFEYRSPFDGSRVIVDYHAGTIYAVSIALLSILFSIIFFKDKIVDFSVNGDFRHEEIAIAIFIIIFGIYTLQTPELFESSKADVLEVTDRGHYLFYTVTGVGFLYAILAGWRTHRLLFVLSTLGLLLTLYIGHRSALAIAIGGWAYVMFRNRSLLTLNPLHILSGFAAILALAVYKSVYVAIKLGDFTAVKNRLLDNPLVDNAIIGLEQFVTFAHLDFVVTYDYTLPCSNLWAVPITLIPFMDEFIDVSACGYNAQVQQMFFSGYPGGVAANIWAEFFANFKYLGIPLVVLVIVLICRGIEYFLNRTKSPLLKSGLALSIIQMTVYIQRKELMGAIVSAKRAIIVALLVYAVAYAVRMVTDRRPATN